jgi:GNAT superfamily N-acetyltransferase
MKIEDTLNNRYQEYLHGLDIYENKNSLILSKIVIKPEFRNEGVGSEIMEDLIKYADTHGKIIALTPSSDFGGSKNRLTQFYKRFGFKLNRGQYKSFQFKDKMIRYPKLKEDKLEGGKADKMNTGDIAKKFKVTKSKIEKELRMGKKIEKEHTGSVSMAKEIAMDHLVEIPDYYTRLKKMEKEGEEYWGKRVSESLTRIDKLLREQVDLSITDETAFSTDYNIFRKGKPAGKMILSTHNPSIKDDAIELVLLKIDEKYQGLKMGYDIIKQIWQHNPNVNEIYVTPTQQSMGFWHKMGAKKMNDTYHVIYKAHS